MRRTSFYADENVEGFLVEFMRERGFRVAYAPELGLAPRDDQFHLQEARRRRAILVTRDTDFLDHTLFPFQNLKDTAVVVLRSPTDTSGRGFGYLLTWLAGEIGASGNKNLYGMKVSIAGERATMYARLGGRIRVDVVDLSRDTEKLLFAEKP